MYARRTWLLRLSVCLNVVVLLYACSYLATSRNGVDFVEETVSGRSLAALDTAQLPVSSAADATSRPPPNEPQPPLSAMASSGAGPSNATRKPNSGATVDPPASNPEHVTEREKTLSEVIKCYDRTSEPRMAQRGDFWVLYNYVRADRTFHCWESITYTTHADYTFLDNLKPLLERWRGPVSLSVHAPGTDFKPTLEAIRWARDCLSPLVAEYVTFHVFFSSRHIPKELPRSADASAKGLSDCNKPAPWVNVSAASLYKTRSRILYPVNVGRNAARESATTHYVLPSDIELYPSPGVIPDFLEMIRRQDKPLLRPNPKVFPLSIFELEKGATLPENKEQLVKMLKNGTAIPFHKKLCPGCHNVPKSKEWLAANITKGLHVFHIGKRIGYHVHWEPIFIGTHQDPLYDERLSWEGKSDKMPQGYALCVLDYEFQILDNAFLVHKPGIKVLKKDPQRAMFAAKTNALIKKVIFPELKVLYGVRKGCAV
ncbi:beta-1,4-glucuronyltransferase 1 [Schistocerca nitens]|uniref:beta-1,4-glucuronyltransferase 1 n=1 Tax=Schistocerca nitens TaxID=7011 RepID=UPI002119B414|nr:beta-1,4-glucuronyltransferase 1 [Schistocerca nitens]XP_049805363.1 beta-1,4-glucuronyltransferase 1 [Schistocerca nitens]XP_049805364.1 beta-1,4-glucuronyltransferase 1 [Schistocerca nitens]